MEKVARRGGGRVEKEWSGGPDRLKEVKEVEKNRSGEGRGKRAVKSGRVDKKWRDGTERVKEE